MIDPKKMKISVNTGYKVLQGLFWMMFCSGAGFVTLYLQGCGVGTVWIGVITAAFGIMAAVLQPLFGGVCDRHADITWKKMIIILAAAFIIVCVLMNFIHGILAGALFIGLLFLLTELAMPFVNSAYIYYAQAGKKINFGTARGIGSATYAMLSLTIGALAEKYGTGIIPICGMITGTAFLIAAYAMPYEKNIEKKTRPNVSRGKSSGFISRYPAFIVMLIASLMMFTSQNIENTFLLQIIQSLGGNSSQLGTAMAIQAIVEVPVLFASRGLLKKLGPTGMMMVAAVGFAVKAFMFAVSESILMIYITQFSQMCSFAVFASASVYYASDKIDTQDQSTGQSFMTGVIAAGAVAGSLVGGFILEFYGVRKMLSLNFVIALLGIVFAVISINKSDKKSDKKCKV